MVYYSIPQPRVYFGDKRSVPIIGYGSTVVAEKAYYVPELKIGVVAISYYDEMGLMTTICNGKMRIFDPSNVHESILLFTRKNKLYILDELYVELLYSKQNMNTSICEIYDTDTYI